MMELRTIICYTLLLISIFPENEKYDCPSPGQPGRKVGLTDRGVTVPELWSPVFAFFPVPGTGAE